ncbi:MAG: TetR family transcriptional regulator [Rhodobacteraceae bacterium PARR1]|nr:MAG: TetR family transcriptional regulator [Rhodobacteraceae bacterium PARR1]
MSDRRPYLRDSEDARRAALVAAVLDLVAEGGVDAATLRAVAARAGVTPGLIRHYFGDKDGLMRAAYGRMMAAMVDPCLAAADAAGVDPVARLAAFLAAALDPAALDGRTVTLWAAYIHRTRHDPALRAAHEAGYLAFRDALEALIAALPACHLPPRVAAIALNALLDGLWLEGGLLPQGFVPGEVQRIALTAAARLLDLPELTELSETEGP